MGLSLAESRSLRVRGSCGEAAPCAVPATAGYGCVMEAIALTVPTGRRFESVVSLVLGGIGSRLDLPVARIEDMQMAVTNMAESVAGTELMLEVAVHDDRVLLCIGPLRSGAASDPAQRQLVDPLVDGVKPLEREGLEWLELDVSRRETG
jgi:hypothetical protein